MLVIHPSDRTTDFLRTLYEGREDVRLLTGKESRKELGSILFHLRPGERAMLLGHGTDAREYGIACSQEALDRENVNNDNRYCL